MRRGTLTEKGLSVRMNLKMVRWSTVLEKGYVDDKDEVEDDTLIFDTQKLMKSLLEVCCLVKNHVDEGEKEEEEEDKEKKGYILW